MARAREKEEVQATFQEGARQAEYKGIEVTMTIHSEKVQFTAKIGDRYYYEEALYTLLKKIDTHKRGKLFKVEEIVLMSHSLGKQGWDMWRITSVNTNGVVNINPLEHTCYHVDKNYFHPP